MASVALVDSFISISPSELLRQCIERLTPEPGMPASLRRLAGAGGSACDVSQHVCGGPLLSTDEYTRIRALEERYSTEAATVDPPPAVSQGPSRAREGLPPLRPADLLWLHDRVELLWLHGRNVGRHRVYLHELLEGSDIHVPENGTVERSPELERRCQRLKTQQDNLLYRSMTKNVDNVRMHYPEDSLAYQMRQFNRQLIAVFQFIVSVATGFVFGFLGIELIVGPLDFGFKLLLGIMCSLIIALAELYFLAKQLNET